MTILIETNRLILRTIDPEKDFEDWADCFSDKETMTFIGGGAGMSRAQAWRHMATVIGHEHIRGYTFLSVIEKASQRWVGRVGPWNPEGWPEPEIGWTIHRNHWRKGYAKEAGAACIDFAFNQLGWNRVVHLIESGNIGSERTASALGSKRLYEVKGIPGVSDKPCWVWGQNKVV